ncbi:MAG: alkyl sulfatase [Spirochaeta sp.]|nr:alkyl sulfatase [Spirochaeta sp.]RPG07330.1 MAG: alkyl sulfatase [Proteobacteria bacterium TMED72]
MANDVEVGETDAAKANPATVPSFTGTLADGVHVLGGMGNALTVETSGGIVQMDTGPAGRRVEKMLESLRELSDAPVRAIAYSHGHLGYNDAVESWLAHCEQRGDPVPPTIAHENLVRRWQRYTETQGVQRYFIELQFRLPRGMMSGQPLTMPMPTQTFKDTLTLHDPVRPVQLIWAPSETDDAVVLWLPEQRILYGGAAATPSIPNIGTPLRSLRDPIRWADTLEGMAALKPVLIVMEFGPPIEGEERIQEYLLKTAAALRWLREAVVSRMNLGMGVVEILHDLEYPPELFDQPWMTPMYGHPDYIVRDIFRKETGWWDRNPTSLHPAHPDSAGAAVLSAIADRGAVLARARELADAGEVQLAMHVVDVLALAPGDDPDVVEARALKAALCEKLALGARSFVSQSLYVSSGQIIGKGTDLDTGLR